MGKQIMSSVKRCCVENEEADVTVTGSWHCWWWLRMPLGKGAFDLRTEGANQGTSEGEGFRRV